VGAAYSVSGRKLERKYPEPPPVSLTLSADSATLARGEHLVQAVGSCAECHGDDLGGKLLMDAGPLGIVYSSNLTSGAGGVATTYGDQDWARAIRHGLRPNLTSLMIMPTEAYARFSDADLSAIISYLKQLPPVDREHGETKLRVVGRALLALNKLPMLSADLVPAGMEQTHVEAAVDAEYGKYLATIGGCNGCHGPDLVGGIAAGPPGSPLSANLTPAGIGDWTEADFFRALREGKRPDGTAISETMPWRFAGRMTDDELRAIWLYLQSVPAKETPAPTS
jgi:mono/diheme cytochrome c family protein